MFRYPDPDWERLSSFSLPVQFREGVQRVVQAVYEQKGRTQPRHGAIDVSYHVKRPGAAYILVKEGGFSWLGESDEFDMKVVSWCLSCC